MAKYLLQGPDARDLHVEVMTTLQFGAELVLGNEIGAQQAEAIAASCLAHQPAIWATLVPLLRAGNYSDARTAAETAITDLMASHPLLFVRSISMTEFADMWIAALGGNNKTQSSLATGVGGTAGTFERAAEYISLADRFAATKPAVQALVDAKLAELGLA